METYNYILFGIAIVLAIIHGSVSYYRHNLIHKEIWIDPIKASNIQIILALTAIVGIILVLIVTINVFDATESADIW